MKTCQMAGERCTSTETVLLRLAGLGDRLICVHHIATLERMGLAYRRLDPETVVPEWRTRSLAKVFSQEGAR